MKRWISSGFTCLSFTAALLIGLQLASSAPKYAPPAPATVPVADVKIDNFSYKPDRLEVAVGTKVTWTNADDVPHTATSSDDPQLFDSGPLDTDEKFSFTFDKAGTFKYYCKVHPHMTGVVVVK